MVTENGSRLLLNHVLHKLMQTELETNGSKEHSDSDLSACRSAAIEGDGGSDMRSFPNSADPSKSASRDVGMECCYNPVWKLNSNT
jgi:hypothetical protein